MWTLFDYVTDGELLGTHRAFARNFEKPIIKAADREADDMDRALGFRLGETLRSIIAPYLLRREKKTVFNTDTETASLALPDQKEDLSLSIPMTPSQISRSSLPKKKELVIWTVLQPAQLDIYKAFILTPEVLKVLNLSRSPLAAIIVLRKICNHPFLLNTSTKMLRGLMSSDSSSTLLNLAKYDFFFFFFYLFGFSSQKLKETLPSKSTTSKRPKRTRSISAKTNSPHRHRHRPRARPSNPSCKICDPPR